MIISRKVLVAALLLADLLVGFGGGVLVGNRGSGADDGGLPSVSKFVNSLSPSGIQGFCTTGYDGLDDLIPGAIRGTLREEYGPIDESKIKRRADEILTYLQDQECGGP